MSEANTAADQTQAIDRTGWPAGPWDGEPDRVEFEHDGLPCLLVRNHFGAWCGYAAVPPGHPLHGKKYDDVDVDVHGGLTYSKGCDGPICHAPKPGEPDDVWWFGFDCAHYFDVVPAMQRILNWGDLGEEYRDLPYARSQTEGLAEQLRAAETNCGMPDAASPITKAEG